VGLVDCLEQGQQGRSYPALLRSCKICLPFGVGLQVVGGVGIQQMQGLAVGEAGQALSLPPLQSYWQLPQYLIQLGLLVGLLHLLPKRLVGAARLVMS